MPTYVLTTPVPSGSPGQAVWTDSTLVPGTGITAQKGVTVVTGVYTLNFIGGGVTVAAGGPGIADITIGGGGGPAPGGIAGSVQFNDGVGGFAGDANLTYNAVNLTVSTGGSTIDIGNGTITGTPNLLVQAAAGGTLTLGSATTYTDLGGGVREILGSIGAAPLPAQLRTNAAYVVAGGTVSPITLPAMLASDDGLRIEIANNVAGQMQVIPPIPGSSRVMSSGGGQVWIWVDALATWICTSNV